jgi:TPR repeat protein
MFANRHSAASAVQAAAIAMLLVTARLEAAALPADPPLARHQAAGSPQPAADVSRPDRDLIALLVRRGEELLSAGDLSGARIMLQRAAKAGNARAALLLGGSYDPTLLSPFSAGRAATDVALARSWYAVARELGSLDARRRLNALARHEPWSDLPSRP